jgi:hypothetical protein
MKLFSLSILLLLSFNLGSYANPINVIENKTNKPHTKVSENLAKRKKIALLVAVGNYAAEGEYPQITKATRSWRPINSINDVPVVKKALINQGFKNNNIAVIENKQATKAGIVKALKDLIEEASEGDLVLFHYSGHGQQIMDDNGDEVDGYDEALVPYDAAVRFQEKVYEGQSHLRDDELEQFVKELRTKLGPQGHLVFVLDACHSGTATRGLSFARGDHEKLAPEGYKGRTNSESDSWNEKVLKNESMASFVLFSGAAANQLNYEYELNGQSMGSLTFAFYKALTNSSSTSTYNGLFDQVRMTMAAIAPRQNPQMEGSSNSTVLSGDVVAPAVYQSVKHIIDPKNLVLTGGSLLGVFEGSTFVFYPMDKDTAGLKPIAIGRVLKSYALESDIVFDAPVDTAKLKNAWAYLKAKSFGDMALKIKLDINGNDNFKEKLRLHFDTLALVDIVEKNPDLIVESNNSFTASRGEDVLQIFSAQDYLVFETNLALNKDVELEILKIDRALLSYAQAHYLRGLNLSSEKFSAKIEIVPVRVETSGRSATIKERLPLKNFMQDSTIALPLETYMVLKITNTSLSDFYFSIFDIQPDNIIQPVFPSKGRTPEEYRLQAGQSMELNQEIFKISPPLGLDMFKIILTRQPLDLRGLINTRGEGTRSAKGPVSPLETLMSESFKIGSKSRGPDSITLPVEEVTIQSLPYKIFVNPSK